MKKKLRHILLLITGILTLLSISRYYLLYVLSTFLLLRGVCGGGGVGVGSNPHTPPPTHPPEEEESRENIEEIVSAMLNSVKMPVINSKICLSFFFIVHTPRLPGSIF